MLARKSFLLLVEISNNLAIRSDMTQIARYQETDRILSEIHFEVHEFLKTFLPWAESHLIGERRQRPFCRLSLCEIMTILVAYQVIGATNFKQFYIKVILQDHQQAFPKWISYSRFVEVAPMALIPLTMYVKFRMEMSTKTMIYVIDSTPLRVCLNLRIPRHKGFAGIAERGKTSTGWFYGFKLHLVTNHLGELMDAYITAGNYDDRKAVKRLVADLKGKLLGDKGYIKKELAEELLQQGLEMMTTLKKNMKPPQRSLADRLLLRKRAIIETVNDLLKNHFQIEHSRHRSLCGLMNNLLAALIAYTFYPNKPKMREVQLNGEIAL